MHQLLRRLWRPTTVDRERAVTEERLRIARELHDVVAHSVSEMVVQASGVRCQLHSDQERERAALLSVEQIGHQALNEMRRMLGVMRSDGELPSELTPQPSLAHLDRLIVQVEQQGLPVTLRIEGERPQIPIGVDLSAYRIVEEALTTALAHSIEARTEVLVRYADDAVEIEIAGKGPGLNGSNRPDRQGLVGMRERVALYGGTLEIGRRDGGGFVLRARLPLEKRP